MPFESRVVRVRMEFGMQAGVPSPVRLGFAQAVEELDLGALGRAVWRKKRWIIGLTLLAAVLAFAGVNVVTPKFKSEARVLIETRENAFLRPEAEKNGERTTTVDQEAITSQVQLMLSRDLAREIIKRLKLNERPEFDPVLGGASILKTVLGLTGIVRDPMNMTPEERVLKSYFDRLSAFQVEKSRVIAIEFESGDPELAAQVANAIAENYLVLQQSAKQEQTRSAGQWLSGEIENLRKRVADAEAKVEQYRAKTNLFIGSNNTMLSNQQLGDASTQFAAARSQKVDAETKSKIIRDTLKAGAPVDFSDIINSELMRRLSEQRVTLKAQLAEQSSTLLDQHPRIKELKAQISDIEREMRAEADRLARSFESDAKLAGARADALSASLDQVKRQASSTNEQDVQLRALERDAKSQRDLLESYLAKYREATARDSIGAASPDARIVSRALVSNTPSWPKKLPTVLIAALAMFVLTSGFVLTGELLRSGTPQPAGVPRQNTPSLAARPIAEILGGKPKQPAAAAPAAALAAVVAAPAGRTVLDAVDGIAQKVAGAEIGLRRVSVMGVQRNTGTTISAITLARALVRQGRVVLVDLALAAPNLSVIASDPAAPGMSDLIQGVATFGQVITRDRYSRVHVITAGRPPADVAALFGSQELAITLEALGRSYDYVVVDAGALPDAPAERFAKLTPFAVLVTGNSDSKDTANACARLVTAGFADVSALNGTPHGSLSGAGTQAAA